MTNWARRSLPIFAWCDHLLVRSRLRNFRVYVDILFVNVIIDGFLGIILCFHICIQLRYAQVLRYWWAPYWVNGSTSFNIVTCLNGWMIFKVGSPIITKQQTTQATKPSNMLTEQNWRKKEQIIFKNFNCLFNIVMGMIIQQTVLLRYHRWKEHYLYYPPKKYNRS